MQDIVVSGWIVNYVQAHKDQDRKLTEERARLNAEQTAAATSKPAVAPTTIPPRNMVQAVLQRPPISRPGSATVFGNIYQGFVRESKELANNHGHGSGSGASTPTTASGASTPTGEKPEKKACLWDKEIDANIARGFHA